MIVFVCFVYFCCADNDYFANYFLDPSASVGLCCHIFVSGLPRVLSFCAGWIELQIYLASVSVVFVQRETRAS